MIRLTAASIAFLLNKSPNSVRNDLVKRKIKLNEPYLIKIGAFERNFEELIVYLAQELLKKGKKKSIKTSAMYTIKKRKGNKGSIGAYDGVKEK